MIHAYSRYFPIITLLFMLYSCSGTQTVSDNTSPVTQDSVDFATLLTPPDDWHHLDRTVNQFPGISSKRAYQTTLKKEKPKKKVLVAVIDGGIDPEHEDLTQVMWTNEDEIPGNQKDDDANGYIDDVHGWNFIGGADGKNVNQDTYELTRIYNRLNEQFATADTTLLTAEQKEEYQYYLEIAEAYENKVIELVQSYENIESLEQSMKQGSKILDRYFSGTAYDYEDIKNLEPDNQDVQFAKNVMLYVMENDIDSALIAEQKKQVYEQSKYGYNPDFNPRPIVGDDYNNKSERYYGNNDVRGPDARHGTHVAGIIAATRNNKIGMNGIASNTEIMAIRAVPDGDERDKDVANAIRYAVDNGADIINMSFGKAYSPYKKVVYEAIKYAESNGVLMIHGAGNEASNSDENPKYPNRYSEEYAKPPYANLWLNIGATSWNPKDGFIADFSNYGDQTVHLFAPGVDIYSTTPDDNYERLSGTSMASPVVAGAAALIMAYYPELNAQQVKEIILSSTVKFPGKMVKLPGNSGPQSSDTPKQEFSSLSISDGLLNLQRALEAAKDLSEQLSTR